MHCTWENLLQVPPPFPSPLAPFVSSSYFFFPASSQVRAPWLLYKLLMTAKLNRESEQVCNAPALKYPRRESSDEIQYKHVTIRRSSDSQSWRQKHKLMPIAFDFSGPCDHVETCDNLFTIKMFIIADKKVRLFLILLFHFFAQLIFHSRTVCTKLESCQFIFDACISDCYPLFDV